MKQLINKILNSKFSTLLFAVSICQVINAICLLLIQQWIAGVSQFIVALVFISGSFVLKKKEEGKKEERK